MRYLIRLLRARAGLMLAVVLAVTLFVFSMPPSATPSERAALAARFRFDCEPLPAWVDRPTKTIRVVHPSLNRISAWVSAVGAAVTLADLDGDDRPNDLLHVDPRTDTVTVIPVGRLGKSYDRFELRPDPTLLYDPTRTAPMGTLVGDFNEDGLPDVLVYYWGRTPVLFVRREPAGQWNRSDLRAEDFRPVELVPPTADGSPQRWYTNSALQADLDGDGHTDLFIANYNRDGARTLDPNGAEPEEMHDTKAKAFNGGRKHLFRWTGPAMFAEQQGVFDERIDRGWTLAAGAIDLDGDLLPELYLANDFGPDRLLHNRSVPGRFQFAPCEGRASLTTPTSCQLGFDSFKGMGADFADLNGDGVPDIFVSNIAADWGLHEGHFLWLSTGESGALSRGVAPYRESAASWGVARSGWAWDAKFADFDNGGAVQLVQAVGFLKGQVNRWPELHALATGNGALVQDPTKWTSFKEGADLSGRDTNAFFCQSGGQFYDIARELNIAGPSVGRGIAVADIDDDGRLDFAMANQWQDSFLYHNRAPRPGQFLGLRPRLPVTASGGNRSRPAFGTVATIHLSNGTTRTAEVDGGNGHSGHRAPELHFGLGSQDAVLRVDVRWRNERGTTHARTWNLAPGWHNLILTEK